MTGDLRFTYSSLLVSYFINDFSAINKESTYKYILTCRNYNDGAFGLQPGLESHGGATYCALVSLKIIGKLDELENKTRLINWLI